MVKIIPLESKHLEELRKWRNDKNIWKYFTNSRFINEIEQEDWFKTQARDKAKEYFVVLEKDKFVGSVWFDEWDKINGGCRVGVFIIPPAQRKGFAYKVLKQFINYLFDNLRLHRVWLLVMKDNKPAIKLYEKLGFKKEGVQKDAIFRNGKYINYLMMGVLK